MIEAPTGRAEVRAWLDAQADRVAGLARAGVARIVGRNLDTWAGSLTASGDLAVLGDIPGAWMTFVHEELLDALGELHYAGVMQAWVANPAVLPELVAEAWTSVVNEAAVSYMTGAANRLVGVGDAMWRGVRSQVVAAVQKGETTEELKGRLEQITHWSEMRADTVARTETNAAYVQGELAAQQALPDGPVEKVWVAALDNRTRDTHAEAHDQCVPFDEKFIVGGVAMDAPFDPAAPPGEVVNCRCVVEYLYPGDTRPDGSVIEGAVTSDDAADPAMLDP